MAEVTWWLPTKNGDYSSRNLWVRVVEMAFLPTLDDHVNLLCSEEEPEGSYASSARSRYWNHDGSAHLEFQEHVIDPPDNFRPNRIQTSWWTDRDGDLESYLRASGWITWEEYRAPAS